MARCTAIHASPQIQAAWGTAASLETRDTAQSVRVERLSKLDQWVGHQRPEPSSQQSTKGAL